MNDAMAIIGPIVVLLLFGGSSALAGYWRGRNVEHGDVCRMRTAIQFWALARWPEIQPADSDIEGRVRVEVGLNMAENTLYAIATEPGA